MSASNLHVAWAELFASALAGAGVSEVVLSPGSRSTPIALAVAAEPRLRVHVAVDERSAAFFALGQARVSGRPSVLVCTSGTAGAHYFPAVIEAAHSFVPMIVVTADRPWHLYDAAAAQTIDQAKLFGGYVRHYAELGLPEASALPAVPRIAAQAVARALHPTPGPTHVNARFSKPLEPVHVAGRESWEDELAVLRERGPSRVVTPAEVVDPAMLEEIAERCSRAERGLIVCGPAIGAGAEAHRAGVLALARATGFPLLAEATSQARFGGAQRGVATCAAFDAVLRSEAFRKMHAADLVLQIGAPPTSSGYARYLDQRGIRERIVIAPYGWNDPSGDATALMLAAAGPLLSAAAARLPSPPRESAWTRAFTEADARAWSIAEDEAAGETVSDLAVARAVVASSSSSSSDDAVLIVGNSSPVRDLDAWVPATPQPFRVLHQRGASGIDGLVAGAAGARSVAGAEVTLLLGDVSLLHDLSALELARRAEAPLPIVVVNNDGGRIFEQLPIARSADPAVFERCFTTPHGLSFEDFARGFRLAYAAPRTRAELADALGAARSRRGATLIEAKVDAHAGALQAARLWARVDRELSP